MIKILEYFHKGRPDEKYVTLADYVRLQDCLARVVDSIDWDQQDASCYYIGEDAAESALAMLGFPWENGVCNEAVSEFLKKRSQI